ncbi:MAG: hypothetical protein D3926_02605 [Desulfobacteraceae bacterium]|nr:MAG: hypothetical protein D3926_02605 [Desulfobacteraceae bacterium]
MSAWAATAADPSFSSPSLMTIRALWTPDRSLKSVMDASTALDRGVLPEAFLTMSSPAAKSEVV